MYCSLRGPPITFLGRYTNKILYVNILQYSVKSRFILNIQNNYNEAAVGNKFVDSHSSNKVQFIIKCGVVG